MAQKTPLQMASGPHVTPTPDPGPVPARPGATLHDQILDVLRSCYDPEIPVNIYDLGLIYEVNVRDDQTVCVKMSLTSPACPVAGSLPALVQQKIAALPGVAGAKVEVVWDPPWTPERMSEAARLQLGLD